MNIAEITSICLATLGIVLAITIPIWYEKIRWYFRFKKYKKDFLLFLKKNKIHLTLEKIKNDLKSNEQFINNWIPNLYFEFYLKENYDFNFYNTVEKRHFFEAKIELILESFKKIKVKNYYNAQGKYKTFLYHINEWTKNSKETNLLIFWVDLYDILYNLNFINEEEFFKIKRFLRKLFSVYFWYENINKTMEGNINLFSIEDILINNNYWNIINEKCNKINKKIFWYKEVIDFWNQYLDLNLSESDQNYWLKILIILNSYLKESTKIEEKIFNNFLPLEIIKQMILFLDNLQTNIRKERHQLTKKEQNIFDKIILNSLFTNFRILENKLNWYVYKKEK